MLPVIGIIGGIGSGKSLVAQTMQSLGGHLVSADAFGHDALRQPDIRAKLVERWGPRILNDQGFPDRRTIARIVFSNHEELAALEALVFPFIEERIGAEIDQAQSRRGTRFVVLDAAIMLEAGWHRRCDKIVFVDAPRDVRLERLKEKRGWDDAELARRESSQMSLNEKKARADAVIFNDSGPEKILPQVKDALERWKVI
ncbi:MAG: dephospho-CoA kinase [Planctomycetes bacterium]|nr:dephospho-CoA kinase [Planctomycetota bacterium]